MLLRALVFVAIVFAVTMVVALFVAFLIKCIGLIVQRGKSPASAPAPKP